MFAAMLAGKPKPKPTKPKPAPPTEVVRLTDQADGLTRKIELERARGMDLETQIAKTRETIVARRLKMGGADAAREDTRKTQRQIKILENRLDKALSKHNDAVARNRQLRNTIDDLRKERLVFDDVYEKLVVELDEKKTEMGAVVEVSNKAFENRDRAVHEMARLKTQANKEQLAFEMEFVELGKQIEHDKKMKQVMRNKADDSEAQAAAASSAAAAVAETEKHKQLVKSKWSFAKDGSVSETTTSAATRVTSYGDAFASIAEFTGENCVDTLVKQFVDAENENFRLFSYVNSLNGEIEKLDEQISEITLEIAKCQGEGNAIDVERQRVLKKLEHRLKTAEIKTQTYDAKYADATKTLEALKKGALVVYNRIGCNPPGNQVLLGEGGVTDANVMQYLGVIEQRTNEILQMFAASRVETGETGNSRFTGGTFGETQKSHSTGSGLQSLLTANGPHSAVTHTPLRIDPPSTTSGGGKLGDEDSETEDDERPLTRDKIRAKMLRALKKREAGKASDIRNTPGDAKGTFKAQVGAAPRTAGKTPIAKATQGRGKENAK